MTTTTSVSAWGRRVLDLQELGWTYRQIAVAVKCSPSRVWQMVSDPQYEPMHSMGQRMRRLHLRTILAERKRRQQTAQG